jgi:glycosyltransferase involved in cell wall biosynthesis
MNKEINLIFLGGFDYPRGMAGTRRIQHAINGLKNYSGISFHVLIVRQSEQLNTLRGTHDGIAYETVTNELSRAKKLLKAPIVNAKTRRTLHRLYRTNRHNILYVYGPPSFDNISAVRFARSIGFKVVFDIVEDHDFAGERSGNCWHRASNAIIRRSTRNISSFADGVIVISSHLENKLRALTEEVIPIHNMPVTVDTDLYPKTPGRFGNPVKFFYAGSFSHKDGVPVLIDAFHKLAARYENICLVMTGRGAAAAIRNMQERIAVSPYKERIAYKGYLKDSDYNQAINSADILCMTRIDTGYAQAGFPFKLGEYLATGKPVIASSVSDVPEFLKDRHDAMLVTSGSSEAIVEAAEVLLNDQENALVIGAQGRATAKRLFDYRAQGKRLYEFICIVAGENS